MTTHAHRPASFDAQLTSLMPRVRNYATRYQHHDPDDLAQAAAVKALNNWRSYTPGAPMMPWLVGHIMNAARVVVPPHANDNGVKHATTPATQEDAVAVKQALALLESRERAAMAVIADGGFPTEIAAALGVTHTGARHLVKRARLRLAALERRADTRRAVACGKV